MARPFRRRPSMSALITRASISSVTPGRVAILAPASEAALRAAVCESDWTVGASTTSAASIASAIDRGGSPAWDARSAIVARTASAPARLGLVAQALAQVRRGGIRDHEHLLALANAEALADDRRYRTGEVASALDLGLVGGLVGRGRGSSG